MCVRVRACVCVCICVLVDQPLVVGDDDADNGDGGNYAGAPHCFPFPVNATQRQKLGHICPRNPTHLFCELLPLWINNTFTYTARKVSVLDACQGAHQRTSPGGYDVTIRMGDHGDGVEIRRQGVPGVSQGEFFLFRVGRREGGGASRIDLWRCCWPSIEARRRKAQRNSYRLS